MNKRVLTLIKTTLALTVILQLILGSSVYAIGNITIYDIEQSKKEIVVNNSGTMMLKQDWYGMSFEIDPSGIYKNKELKAVNQKEYEKALKDVKFDINKVGQYYVFFLDYRLKNYASAMALSFTDRSVVVFGAYKKMTKREIHRLAVHELGHHADFQLMNEQKWEQYKAIRGIQDESKYNNNAANHKNRPQEIFAEDFRMILGGDYAKVTVHENRELQDPTTNTELVGFFTNLVR